MTNLVNEEIAEGDLVYLPANVKLIQTHEDGTVSRYTLTEKPMGVIITKERWLKYSSNWTNFCEVLYNSERWLVHHKDLYKPNEK